MDIPPKGSILRSHYELGVRWRQLGRALAKSAPILGMAGIALAGKPLLRGYPSDKTVRRSDAITGRNPRTTRIIEWSLYGLVIAYGLLVTFMALTQPA